ncbi:XRE family transcriptional regulator [Eubacteriaceae bacterium ES2]|nr:XRE family transcriptional regulator [Eubacteriaceae bacterium ES2]
MNDNKKVVPYRIRQARVSRGYSMSDLAELTGVTKQAISQYEQGKHEPNQTVLNNLIAILKYPYTFFYKPLPETNNSSSAVFFRSRKTAKKKDLNAAREKIEIFREITDYLSDFVDFPGINIPKIDYFEQYDALDLDKIEEYAQSLRSFWQLGNQPIDNLINAIQKNGILVSKMQINAKKVDAFSVWYESMPYIFINDNNPSNARIRFSLAHELGHLILHSDHFLEDELDEGKVIDEKLEQEANDFASALLLPKETFSKDVYSTSIDHFIQLKRKWKVSISAMIHRCDSLGLLNDNQIKYLKDQMTRRVYWRKEPFDNEMPVEKPFAHKQAVTLLLDNNLLTPSQFVHDVGCFPEELESYCFLDKGTLAINNDSNVIQLKPRLQII